MAACLELTGLIGLYNTCSSDHDGTEVLKKTLSRKLNLPMLNKTSPLPSPHSTVITRPLNNKYRSSPELRRKVNLQASSSKTISGYGRLKAEVTPGTVVELGSKETHVSKTRSGYGIDKSKYISKYVC